MILIEDGKCVICSNRDNVVALNDCNDHRTVTIICKDCLIDVLINFTIYGNMKQLLFEYVMKEDLQKSEDRASDIVFNNIQSAKDMQKQ